MSRDSAEDVPRRAVNAAPSPRSTDIVDTTLSFAMNPVIRAVTTLQSPKPRGLKIGDSKVLESRETPDGTMIRRRRITSDGKYRLEHSVSCGLG